ncbi:MAG: hypothetical protein SFW62_10250 [Alphaproteobacteria bacterium]|nr:hypothetical protein [Alphaproteobacteria bacterium]
MTACIVRDTNTDGVRIIVHGANGHENMIHYVDSDGSPVMAALGYGLRESYVCNGIIERLIPGRTKTVVQISGSIEECGEPILPPTTRRSRAQESASEIVQAFREAGLTPPPVRQSRPLQAINYMRQAVDGMSL